MSKQITAIIVGAGHRAILYSCMRWNTRTS